MKNHIFRRGLAMRFTPTASSIYDQRIIKKSLKQPIFVNAHHDEFVQCVSTNLVTHDIFHVLLDFDTIKAEEIGVLAYAAAQITFINHI
ncbi:hypothetical protein [Nostoc sp.]|uniref:hypothetical protein n=1 Tax=Nostoc sp. TaxID=1180 RepID=UPI002FFCFB8D